MVLHGLQLPIGESRIAENLAGALDDSDPEAPLFGKGVSQVIEVGHVRLGVEQVNHFRPGPGQPDQFQFVEAVGFVDEVDLQEQQGQDENQKNDQQRDQQQAFVDQGICGCHWFCDSHQSVRCFSPPPPPF